MSLDEMTSNPAIDGEERKQLTEELIKFLEDTYKNLEWLVILETERRYASHLNKWYETEFKFEVLLNFGNHLCKSNYSFVNRNVIQRIQSSSYSFRELVKIEREVKLKCSSKEHHECNDSCERLELYNVCDFCSVTTLCPNCMSQLTGEIV